MRTCNLGTQAFIYAYIFSHAFKHNKKHTWHVNTSNATGAANAEIHILCQQINATTLDGGL